MTPPAAPSTADPSTAAASAWYQPGDRWLVVARRSMVVSEGPAADAVEIWRAVSSGAGVGDLLLSCVRGSLMPEGWSAPGAFAIAVAEEAGTRVLVRGIEDVIVLDSDGVRTAVGVADLLTWTEVLVPDAVEVRIGDADGVVLPVPIGVVRAGALRWQVPTGSTDRAGSADPAGAADRAAGPVAGGTVDTSGVMEPDPPGPDPAVPAGEPEPEPDHPQDPDDGSAQAAESARPPTAGIRRSVEETRGDLDPDELHRVIDAVPLSVPDRSPAAVRGRLPRVPAPSVAPAPLVDDRVSDDRVPDDRPPRGDDPLPVRTVVPTATDPLGDAASYEGDHDGLTQLAEDLPVGYTPPPLPATPPPGSVLAALCPAGHPNAPHSRSCRLCGQLIVQGEPVAVPRPVLARIRLSTGEVIEVDRAIVIGRSPYVSRVAAADLPRLVAVPSPNQDISRAHAEIRPEDWHLVVADLDSTNGTTVRAPGRTPQRLRPAQEVVVEPGWTVELADGISFVVEAV